jgi:single-stranded-DNA-specific exonuclease
MPDPHIQRQVSPQYPLPQWFLEAVKNHTPSSQGYHAAQLLWQRGINNPEQLSGFLNPDFYQPASPFEFGQEMQWAVERLQQACRTGKLVAIWGDFDADGITSTAVLWEGLGEFFQHEWQLIYYIPNRLTESHGLNCQGIDILHKQGCRLIVTCDTGSTNIREIEYAQKLGIDIIVTDHHTLPAVRPPVKAIINPRYLSPNHQLFHLSGVAVAYKLVEALYETLPEVPNQPLENLLDLVAIGLIADLVQLSGDCRYLAQLGIRRLQQQAKIRSRPGIARLLELCHKNGDRPTDISFGLGPRINAVSRIHGEATFCVELLTSLDEKRTKQLAEDTELANTRRKSLQKDLTQQVKKKLEQIDLSTTSVIVLQDPQWAVGVLGLVAGQIAQEYGRPVILLTTEAQGDREALEEFRHYPLPTTHYPLPTTQIARGSARSVNNIDLYELVKSQEHLLERFGGHPFAAGLSLPVENIGLFTEAINQQLRQKNGFAGALIKPVPSVDLVVKVAELGKELFHELKLLEPCGMGNPVPKLLIQNCWFEEVSNRNTQDWKGRKVQYIKTELEIWDDSSSIGFPGIWWGHYQNEVPQGRCHAIVELDYNNYKKRTEVRIVELQSIAEARSFNIPTKLDWILDWRGMGRWEALGEFQNPKSKIQNLKSAIPNPQSPIPLTVSECPISWDDLQVWFKRAIAKDRKLAIAYPPPVPQVPQEIWEKLVGIAKYLSRTGKSASLEKLQEKLDLSDRTLHLGLIALSNLGFGVRHLDWSVEISWNSSERRDHPREKEDKLSKFPDDAIREFLAAVEEEQFLRQYFYKVPLSTIQAQAAQTAMNEPEFHDVLRTGFANRT